MFGVVTGPLRNVPATATERKRRILSMLKHFFTLNNTKLATRQLVRAVAKLGIDFTDRQSQTPKQMLGLVQNFLVSGQFDEWYFSKYSHIDASIRSSPKMEVVEVSSALKCSAEEAYSLLSTREGLKRFHPFLEKHHVVEWSVTDGRTQDSVKFATCLCYLRVKNVAFKMRYFWK